MADAITVTLAHPLDAATAAALGIVDVRDYAADEQALVPRDQVMRLVNSGRVAGVDPADEAAVRALLGLPPAPVPLARPIAGLWHITYPGPAAVQVGALRWYNDTGRPIRIRMVRATVAAAPTGGSLRVNVRRDGASIFTGTGAQPTIGDGQVSGAAPPDEDLATVAPGQYLTVDIETVGATTPGSNLVVTVTASDANTGGIPGAPGHTPVLHSGTGPPAALHADGDLYLQSNGDLYQQQDGVWVLAGNLQGPPGGGGGQITINGVTGNAFELDAADVDAVPFSAVLAADTGVPAWRHTRNWPVAAGDANVAEVRVQSELTSWLNEAGMFRAMTPAGAPADTQFRAVLGAAQTGNPFEVVSHDQAVTVWGIRPDGATVRNGIAMAPVLMLAVDDPVPDGTPPGTIIIRS